MGTNMNFKNTGSNQPPSDGGGGGNQPPGNYPITRQGSVYSLTFDEFQSTMGGGIGKDFGSINMDELLKNIWSAEETQTMASFSTVVGLEGNGGLLQKQGSLTLPRTLSHKTVDEVWRDMSKEFSMGKIGGEPADDMPQRQKTLGEITLEEFLVRAGVVREENNNPQLSGKVNNVSAGFFGELPQQTGNSNTGFGVGSQQAGRGPNLMGNWLSNAATGNQLGGIIQPSNLPLNVNGVRSNQQQQLDGVRSNQQQQLDGVRSNQQQQLDGARSNQQQQLDGVRSNQQQLAQQQQRQPIFPKQPGVEYGAQTGSPGIRGGGQGLINGLIQGGGGIGMVGLGGPVPVGVATGSPANHLSSDGIGKSSGDTSSVSPVPYVFNGSLRGRKCNVVEKVVERRQRRMIKNRESAARSRARKQAYTMELEEEVAKLKEENQKLQKKHALIMKIQKNQDTDMMRGAKKRCLRRTRTGPW